jgi:hypothetical protein
VRADAVDQQDRRILRVRPTGRHVADEDPLPTEPDPALARERNEIGHSLTWPSPAASMWA